MSAESKIKLVILMEPEIRKAAKLIKQALDLQETSTPEETREAWLDALRACMVCLHGAERDDVILILAAGGIWKGNKK